MPAQSFFYTGGHPPSKLQPLQLSPIPRRHHPVRSDRRPPPSGSPAHIPSSQVASLSPLPTQPSAGLIQHERTASICTTEEYALSPSTKLVTATQKRLHAAVTASEAHSPAAFMSEITAFVESQLQQLNRRYPSSSLQLTGAGDNAAGTGLTRLQEEQYRSAGLNPSVSLLEKYRKARLDVFTQAQRMFAESFQTYRLFLDALADEHVSYDRFLESEVTRYKEVIAGMAQELRRRDDVHVKDLRDLKSEYEAQIEKLTLERDKAIRQRQLMIEAQRERHKEFDSKKQIEELTHRLQAANESIVKIQEQNEVLKRQNETLMLGTFSDALDTANQQLAESKLNLQRKDDLLIEAHDEIAILTRDLRKIVHFFNGKVEQPLTHRDVRIGDVTMRALFPDEAKKLVRF